ncbi:MAG: bifunctional MFS transporter/dTMP kinase [Pseudonocardia sp.]
MPQFSPPTAHRVRSVLAIPPFRRLWLVTAVSATGDWLSLLALSALATQLTTGYQAQSFALGGVVATKLLPALLLGPLAGALADKFDRRKVMVICDILRFGLFISIPLVGSLWWLFAATFLIEICALFWIPAKDASVPNLLRRPDQVETANQLALVMTYGVAVITAAGLFSILTGAGALIEAVSPQAAVNIALIINGVAYLLTALTVWFRIPEISGRAGTRPHETVGLLALLREGAKFVSSTPLVRGLVIGILGAFAAGGAVIASTKLYATSLGGGDAAYGVLFVAVFIGMAIGMGVTPRLARRLPHNRLFGSAIVAAGIALVLVAIAPHLFVAIVTVGLVGAFAGMAFLTGLTIIGAQVADEIRGRVVAFVQSLVRIDLLASMAVVPFVIGLVQPRTLRFGDFAFVVDGTRTVLLAGGLIAGLVGVVAYRQMDDRRSEPLLPDLLAVLRRGDRRGRSGVLLAVEGATSTETAEQANRLVAWLRSQGHDVVASAAGEPSEGWLAAGLRNGHVVGTRARALTAAAVRADLVEREIRPALDSGAIVVVDRFLASPLVQLGVAAERQHEELDHEELESLAGWATGRLRPDVTVLLDRAPEADRTSAAEPEWPPLGDEHARVQRLLTRMAAAEPHKYVVVDADGPADVVAERVRDVLGPLMREPAKPSTRLVDAQSTDAESTDAHQDEAEPDDTQPDEGKPADARLSWSTRAGRQR